ncbi:MAG: helix-turn-helix transcriptional regulator [Coriobacteriales bacterium]|nr:helix-turn-helix transcriptional regulator [Coriobacteriaceae bacterium]MDY2723918.1 helix-turn-helix transcriptional regulator [Coriobacteriales bacterium]
MKTRIRELREAQGLTRRELAERASVTASALVKWEDGTNEIGFDKAERIARALQCTLSDLIGPDAPQRDKRFDELAGLYRSMSDEGKAALLAAARGLATEFPGEALPSGLSAYA